MNVSIAGVPEVEVEVWNVRGSARVRRRQVSARGSASGARLVSIYDS